MWFEFLKKGLEEIGFEQSSEDKAVFYKGETIFVVYVDDGILMECENMVEIGGPYVDKMRCRQDSLYAIHKTILILTLKDIRFSHMMDLCQGIGSTVSKVSSCQHSVANHLFGRSSCFHSQGDKIATLQPTHQEQTDSIGCSRCWL